MRIDSGRNRNYTRVSAVWCLAAFAQRYMWMMVEENAAELDGHTMHRRIHDPSECGLAAQTIQTHSETTEMHIAEFIAANLKME